MSSLGVPQSQELIQLAQQKFSTLGEAENKLLIAAINGETAYCGPRERDDDSSNDPANSANWGSERSIRAELVRWFCVDKVAREYVHSSGIRVHEAGINGKLDLSYIAVPFHLGLARCNFSHHVDLRFAQIPTLDFTASLIPSMDASYSTIRGSVTLSHLSSKGKVDLMGASIGGTLVCNNINLLNPDGMALSAGGVSVTGSVILKEGVVEGEVSFTGAHIGGNLDCTKSVLKHPAREGFDNTGVALRAYGANISRNVFLQSLAAEGEVMFSYAEIKGEFNCSKGSFRNLKSTTTGSGIALCLDSARVGGHVFLHGFTAEGQVRLVGAEFAGSFECIGSRIENPPRKNLSDGVALEGQAAKITGPVLLRDFTSKGTVHLWGVYIGSSFACENSTFVNPGGKALDADCARVVGPVFLKENFSAEGHVTLAGAEIGQNLDCSLARFQHLAPAGTPHCEALNVEGAKVTGSVFLHEFLSKGELCLKGARIGGNLECKKAAFDHLDLTNASAGAIHHEDSNWPEPGKLYLDGFTYGRIAAGLGTHKARLDWLARHGLKQHEPVAPQPFRHLAKVLKDAGDDKGSRQVLAELEQRKWKKKNWFLRLGGHLLRLTIGYGYFPMRALWCLLALIVIGFLVYWAGYYAGSFVPTDKNAYDSLVCSKGVPVNYPTFHALAYSLENSFPPVKLGISDKWTPGALPISTHAVSAWISPGFLQWFRWSQICAGWMLATLFVIGFTGIIRKD